MKKEIDTKEQLLKILKILPTKNRKHRNAVVCSLIGHSRIQRFFWGYFSCGRCGDQLGDTLCSVYPFANKAVVIGHDCDKCRENYKECTWKDKLYTQNPFKTKT
jgi:hypothetical protein